MISLLLLLLFSALALVLLDGNWRGGLLVMLLIGFLQDPIRKLTPNQPGLFVGLALVAFTACVLTLAAQRNRLEIDLLLRAAPQAKEWLLMFLGLIALQAANSYARFADPVRTGIGIGFYMAPLVGLWMGFQIGRDQRFLRRFLQIYLLGSALVGISVFLDYRGVNIPLFREVGGGIMIHFRAGFSVYGASGLWRTSELAAWHLAASACLAMTMGFACKRLPQRYPWLLLAASFTFLTLTTGRRKALVLVLVFITLYLLLFSRTADRRSREQVITALLGSLGLGYGAYVLILVTAAGDNFNEYLNRALSAKDDILSRFQAFAVSAASRGLESSDGFGLGVGALAQTGDLRLQAISGASGNTVFVSESGLGKVIAELGIPGLIVLVPLAVLIVRGLLRCLPLLRLLPPATANLELGLLAFAVANIPFFFAAAGIYGDPLVLILCGICLGSYLAVPALLLQQQREQQRLQGQPGQVSAGQRLAT